MGQLRGIVQNRGMPLVLVAVPLAGLAVASTLWTPVATVLLAGTALMLASPLLQRLARQASWALPLVVAILTILLDFRAIASSAGLVRYTGAAIVLTTVVAMRSGGARTGRALWICAAALCAYGLLGTIFGRFWLGTQDGALPVVLPLFICLAGWARPGADEAQLRFALKVLAVLGAMYAFWTAGVRMGVLPGDGSVYSHEKAFVMVLAVASAMAARSRWLTVFSIGGTVVAFATYPAATYVVAGGTALLTLMLIRWCPSRSTRKILGVASMTAVLWAVMHVDALVRFTAAYFTLVGKTDNGSTRAALYATALGQLKGSPVFAHFFTSDLTVVTTLSGRAGVVLPVHNDYLGVALSGGIVAAALLLALFIFSNGCAIHAVKIFGRSSTQGRAIVALLASLNAAAVTAFANPIFMNPGSSTVVYAIIFALVSLCVGAEVKVSQELEHIDPHDRRAKPLAHLDLLNVRPEASGAFTTSSR